MKTQDSSIRVSLPETLWMEIDLDVFASNIKKIVKKANGSRVMLIVKSNAYGCGAPMIARSAIENGVHSLGVARAFEGVDLRIRGITSPILNMGYISDNEVFEIVTHDITQTVSDLELAKKLNSAALALGRVVNIHLKVDTGMKRLGVSSENAVSLIKKISKLKNLRLEGLFTHFPIADDINYPGTNVAEAELTKISKEIKELGIKTPIIHCNNSSAFLNFSNFNKDMVRIGLIAYGYFPSEKVKKDVKVKPIVSLKSLVSNVRKIKAGEGVSYNHTFVAEVDTNIAVVPIGYADGLPRSLSNNFSFFINDKLYPIVGNVTMDQTMLSLGLDNVKVGDSVVVFGNGNNNALTIEDAANFSDTITYEIQCGISSRVPRVYIKAKKNFEIQRFYLR